ncbi:MAG: hypothetical protein FWH34_01770 [Desulfovibrionaceae bacterium]|nr:hypothetical protein [Desulfovibrionaceae bacterium]
MRSYAICLCSICILLLSLSAQAGNALAAGQQTPNLATVQKAADQGNADAQYQLGLIYRYGRGVPIDTNKALALFKKAAEQGNAQAYYSLAGVYDIGGYESNGGGVPIDRYKALEYYQKAAELGNVNAQIMLGYIYAGGYYDDSGTFRNERQGYGVKDDRKAVEWFQKAAAQGDADAQRNLEGLYREGRGVTKDENKVIKPTTPVAQKATAAPATSSTPSTSAKSDADSSGLTMWKVVLSLAAFALCALGICASIRYHQRKLEDANVSMGAVFIEEGTLDNLEQEHFTERGRAMAMVNKIERVALSGGILGALFTNPRRALESLIEQHNKEGWRVRQIIPHDTTNIAVKIFQIIVLLCTLFLWTFGAGYLIVFEKEKND